MSDKKDIGWMYHGAKSEVNREDYLLGKRVCFHNTFFNSYLNFFRLTKISKNIRMQSLNKGRMPLIP